MARTVGIGIQEFDEIIEHGYFYVDKTSFIKEWWENGDKVTLITRPRRFGKTLSISMTEQFFFINYAEKSNLFHGLNIWKNDDFQKLQGSYPVISISFAGIKETSYENAREKICQIIADLYADHTFLLDCGVLADGDKNFFRRVTYDMKDAVASLSLYQLSKYLSRYYGKKTMILLDEYDTPMQEAYTNGYWEELVLFTRNLFHNTFKTNPYLERGLLTGITRVSKESVFSDLNNLEVVTTTSEKYAEAFGFTEKEVFDALEEYGIGNQKNAVSQWYDGFTFGSHGNIYNPWSIINFLDKKKFAPYWINTSSNKLISKLLQEGSADVKLDMEELIDGKDFVVCIDEEVVYNQLGHNENAIWSLLLASGYLKVKNLRMNSRFKMEYCLTLTNLETRLIVEQMLGQNK